MAQVVVILVALIWTYLASILVEWAVIARIFNTPAVGIAVSSLIGTAAVILLRSWIASQGAPLELPPDTLLYVLAGAVIGTGRMILRHRSDLAAAQDPIDETFR